ncbi:MAG TPA: TMEM14 family protein [Verrucomicrobiota bacterium]|nr:TMEM14 family protein [Verrucomicrobiota bacterium]
MSWTQVVWIYVALLLAGGIFGFVKAGSRASLIASTISAALLGLAAAGVLPFVTVWIVLGALLAVFAMRLAKTKKFMPAGMLLIVTLLVLAAVYATRR